MSATRERRDAVLRLAGQGYSPVEIAARLKILTPTVKMHLRRARLRGEPVPHFQPLQVGLSRFEWSRLEMAAAQRGTDAYRLVHKLISIIVRDDMFAAVIDDELIES